MQNTLNRLETRLENIEALLKTMLEGAPPRNRTIPEPPTLRNEDLIRERVVELERIFWKIVNTSRVKREDSYRFPQALFETVGQPRIEAVPASVLLNQAALRKIFKTRGKGDSAKDSPLQRARLALEQSTLVRLAYCDTELPSESSAMIAFSPDEAWRQVKPHVTLDEPVGWSCTERAAESYGMTGKIPARISEVGMRVWPVREAPQVADEEVAVVDPGPQKGNPRVDLAAFAMVDDSEEILDEDESGAEADFGEDDAVDVPELPVSHIRTRVQFVED